MSAKKESKQTENKQAEEILVDVVRAVEAIPDPRYLIEWKDGHARLHLKCEYVDEKDMVRGGYLVALYPDWLAHWALCAGQAALEKLAKSKVKRIDGDRLYSWGGNFQARKARPKKAVLR